MCNVCRCREIAFENAVLIFDEAHNLEDSCSESASVDLSARHLASCVGEVRPPGGNRPGVTHV
eukprot:1075102-Pyramimonas_sp.AAC.2